MFIAMLLIAPMFMIDRPFFMTIELASEVIKGAAESVLLPERKQGISVSIGICIYRGSEKNYSEIFKKADMALYQAKTDAENRYRTYQNETGKGGEEWQLT